MEYRRWLCDRSKHTRDETTPEAVIRVETQPLTELREGASLVSAGSADLCEACWAEFRASKARHLRVWVPF